MGTRGKPSDSLRRNFARGHFLLAPTPAFESWSGSPSASAELNNLNIWKCQHFLCVYYAGYGIALHRPLRCASVARAVV